MKKTLAILLVLVMALCLFAGCQTNEPDDGAKGTVYWLNFKPELDETIQALGKTYTEKTGVPVKIVTAASGTYSQTLTSEMDKSSAPTPPLRSSSPPTPTTSMTRAASSAPSATATSATASS